MVGKLQHFYLPLSHSDINSVAVLKIAIQIPSVESSRHTLVASSKWSRADFI